MNAVEDGGGRVKWRRGRVAARARAVGSGWRQVICNSKWVTKYDPLAEASCSFAGRNQRLLSPQRRLEKHFARGTTEITMSAANVEAAAQPFKCKVCTCLHFH